MTPYRTAPEFPRLRRFGQSFGLYLIAAIGAVALTAGLMHACRPEPPGQVRTRVERQAREFLTTLYPGRDVRVVCEDDTHPWSACTTTIDGTYTRVTCEPAGCEFGNEAPIPAAVRVVR